MADIKRKLRNTWIKGMETIGTTASGIASNAKYKVDEMNLVNRRRELLTELAKSVFELHSQGVSFPEQVEAMLQEIDSLDVTIRVMREEHIISVTPAGVKLEPAAEELPADPSSDTMPDDQA